MAKKITARAEGKRFLTTDLDKHQGPNRIKEGSKSNQILKVFLEGVYYGHCELSRLKGMWHILKRIWKHVTIFWKESILVTANSRGAIQIGDCLSFIDLTFPLNYEIHPFISVEYEISFPEQSGLNINMMPFIMSTEDSKDCKLPKKLKRYWEDIISQCPIGKNEEGKIGYLTIHESDVKRNHSQRRPGLHTERPGRLYIRNEEEINTTEDNFFGNGCGVSEVQVDQIYYNWGIGFCDRGRNCEGGIFMASNVDNSCRVWDCQITNDEVIGNLGDIEHLREYLPSSEIMKANHLYWMRDRTPHESLSLKNRKFRQYFRLVTSQVSLWFEEHSTKNPLGVVPDPEITKIVGGSKFVKNGLYFVKQNTGKEESKET